MSVGSLRLRLLILGVIFVNLALVASAIGLELLFERHVERRVDAELNAYLNQLVAGLDRNAAGDIALVQSPSEPRFERPLSGLYWQILIERSGKVITSRSLWDVELALPQASFTEGSMRRHGLSGPGGEALHVLERRFELPARLGGASIRAAVGVDTREIREAVRGFVVDMVPYLVVVGALLVAAAWAQVTVGLRPLSAVRDGLTAIRTGNTLRLGTDFPDEVKPLAIEIDALLDARDIQIDKARARAADLAHGLKTPLQVLAGEAERLRAKGEREVAAAVTTLASVMHRHIERELTRARLAAGSVHARANVGEVAERVVNVVRRTPDGQRLEWLVDISRDLLARIDADDLAEALGNLIENAARHAQARVRVSGCADGEHTVVTVADDGPGIPPERLAQALSRGGRLDASRSGSGLGLAIVSEIAEAWGARFSIEDARPGVKASLRFRRPERPPRSLPAAA
jgi:signal transduction histidine kinase